MTSVLSWANSDATRSNKIISGQWGGGTGWQGVLVEQLPLCLRSITPGPRSPMHEANNHSHGDQYTVQWYDCSLNYNPWLCSRFGVLSPLYQELRLNIHVSLILLSWDLSGYHKTQIVTNRAPSYSDLGPHTESGLANQRTIKIRLNQWEPCPGRDICMVRAAR